ncbi:sensor histidine kinase N-terminal domain-containing protein [Nitratireductor kimnyeongensis]|uniref:histidine kinase n=1 Tax=Nitratireductor kimnyeongensis TaxID=430679 RepID=A0ABW0T2L0_9HYPH|nr:sensor histidine kinase [Nitratireductor kimnyeongensis]QZZ35386.1 sensor histidine kinase [Nitratireductor kimnyeongensis]
MGQPVRQALPGRSLSIVYRLTISLTLVLTLAVAATIWAAYGFGRQAANEAFDRLLQGAALQIAERIFVVEGEVRVDIPVSAFALLSLAKDERVFYRVAQPDGTTLTGYEDFPMPDTERIREGGFAYEVDFGGERVRALAMRRRLAERAVSGDIHIIVAHTTGSREQLARSMVTQAVAVIAGAGLAILILALLAMRYAMRPLERIQTAILERDPLDLSPFSMHAPDEVSALVTSINRFMGRLDRRVRAMQDYVADSAHQIRTSITALRAHSELALEEEDPQRLKSLHRRIRSRAIGLNRLTDQLLSHALVTHRADTAPLELLDLRRIAVGAERDFVQIAGAQRPRIRLDLPEEPVMVRGDAFSLREAVKNLLNNAHAHGTPPVDLTVALKDDRACIAVTDRGEGLPVSDATEIGHRFAINPNKPESAGLGLAIVREVAEFHHGRITLDREKRGFTISLDLPLTREGTEAS